MEKIHNCSQLEKINDHEKRIRALEESGRDDDVRFAKLDVKLKTLNDTMDEIKKDTNIIKKEKTSAWEKWGWFVILLFFQTIFDYFVKWR